MLRKPKLIGIDLDGTLLCPKRSLLPRAHERVINAIKHRGIAVALVTGRPLLTTAPIWHRLKLQTPIVCFNGAWVGFPNEDCIAQHPLSAQDTRDIIQVLSQFPGSTSAYPSVYTWKMNRLCETTQDWPKIYKAPIEIDPVAFEHWQHPSPKVLFACKPAIIDDAMRAIRCAFGNRFHAVKSQADRFEVQQPVHKAIGLAALAVHMDLSSDEVWSIGDAANDIEMLQWTGQGFVMGHAPHAVREIGDVVLPSIEARGLSALLPYLEAADAIKRT